MTTWTVRWLLLLLAALCLIASPAAADTLFNNTNPAGVQTGGNPQSPSFTLNRPAQIKQITTYHWNNGRGDWPGTLSLRSSSGQTYGPFQAHATSGQGNAPNVNWIADVNVTVPAGTYTVVDSKPKTWSFNQQSRNAGFAQVYGNLQAAGGGGGGTPPPPSNLCAPNANAVAAMGPCQGPANTPVTVVLQRQLKTPLAFIVFRPVRANIPPGVPTQITQKVSGGTSVGSRYTFGAPIALCVGGSNGNWSALAVDGAGQQLGIIGSYTITNCP